MLSPPVTDCESPEGVRDESVEALAEMADRQRTRERRAADREVQIQQLESRIVRREPGLPPGPRTPGKHGVGTLGRQEPHALAAVLPEQLETTLPLEPVRQDARRARRMLQAASTADPCC